jgi:hypothetical protein
MPLAAFVFGPEHGAVSEQMVFQTIRETYAKRILFWARLFR